MIKQLLLFFCTLGMLLIIPKGSMAQIQLLNDEFDNAATLHANWLNINDEEGWNAEHLEVHDVDNSTTGHLHMMPWSSSWYQDFRGTLIHKRVDQNFVVTSEVTVTNRAGTELPSSSYSLAGIMLRTPRNFSNGAAGWTAGGENYIFLATGFAANNHPTCSGCPGPHFEVKTTTERPFNPPSQSNLEVSSIPTASNVQIRVARIDHAIIVLNRFPGGNWQVHQRYDRSDFPTELQVGFVTYTDWPKISTYAPNNFLYQNSNVINANAVNDPTAGTPLNPDLIGQFDYARFDEVVVPTTLMGVDLVSQASDAELLSFLGYDSEAYCPFDIHVDRTITVGQIAEMSVQNDLTADNLIQLNADVSYKAGHSLEFQDDFEVVLGAEFSAEIDVCN